MTRPARPDTDLVRRNVDWQDDGACNSVDPELFYTQSYLHDHRAAAHQTRVAKQVCRRCPVIAKCLEWALEIEDVYAILGGTTPVERAKMHGQQVAS